MLDKFGQWVLSGPDWLFFIRKRSQTKLHSARCNSSRPVTTFSDCRPSQTFWLTLPNQTAAESHCLQTTEYINAQLNVPLHHTGTPFKSAFSVIRWEYTSWWKSTSRLPCHYLDLSPNFVVVLFDQQFKAENIHSWGAGYFLLFQMTDYQNKCWLIVCWSTNRFGSNENFIKI